MFKFFIFFPYIIGPTLAWLFLSLWWDRKRPEPKHQIIRAFLLGGLTAILLVFFNISLTNYLKESFFLSPILMVLLLSFLVDGLIEEGGKLISFRFGIYHLKHFDEPIDGMIYGFILGLGFAFVENIFYAYALTKAPMYLAKEILFLRGFTATLMHFIAGGIIGYYFALAKFRFGGNPLLIFQGFFLAFLFHGFYNTLSRIESPYMFLSLLILLMAIFIFLYRGFLKLKKTLPASKAGF